MAVIYKSNCPCRNCSKRNQGCHAKCNDYKLWKSDVIIVEKPWNGVTPATEQRHIKFLKKYGRKNRI